MKIKAAFRISKTHVCITNSYKEGITERATEQLIIATLEKYQVYCPPQAETENCPIFMTEQFVS